MTDGYPASASESLSELMRLAYDELLEIAGRYLRRERRVHDLQPADLVHEAYIRLKETGPAQYQNNAHFFGAVSRAMRQILIEDARRAKAQKRGGKWRRVELDQVDLACHETPADGFALRKALRRLSKSDPSLSRIVEMRLLRELSTREIAARLHMGQSTVRRDWASARTWLQGQIESSRP